MYGGSLSDIGCVEIESSLAFLAELDNFWPYFLPQDRDAFSSRKIALVLVKVKCTLVQALRLRTGRTAHRGNRGIALPFLDHGTRRWWGVSSTPRPLFTPGRGPVPIIQEAGWAPGPVWTGAENLVPTGIRSPDRPAPSQSLYRLSYPAHACISILP